MMNTRTKGPIIMKIPTTNIIDTEDRQRIQPRAKVKVQYIQKHHTVESNPEGKSFQTSGERTDLENVEYLDESMTEELTSGEAEFNTKHVMKQSFKDTFYPNAIHCLIALYKDKYLDMKGKTDQQIRGMHIWDQITQEMNDSYFTFNRTQVREKFKMLRKQYFSISNVKDIEMFEYFDQLHDIYHDKYIEHVLEGKYETGRHLLQREYIYRDDKLQQEEETQNARVIVESPEIDIAHKEHEFIDMVEKELQALEEDRYDTKIISEDVILDEKARSQEEIFEPGETSMYSIDHGELGTQDQKLPVSTRARAIIKRDQNEEFVLNTLQAPKRLRVEETTPVQIEQDINHAECKTCKPSKPEIAAGENIELLLSEYNTHQERRHQERMALLRKSLAIQERALEIQNTLMQELLKRL